jgi:uncharacterized protein YjbK
VIEKELKSLISREKYEELLDFFNFDETFEQINFYYIDNENIAKKKKINVRVRQIEEKFFLQVKTAVRDYKGLSISDEHEEELPSVPEVISGEKISKITKIQVGDLHSVGSLKTLRSLCRWNGETLICLDKNSYLDTVDYEIEVEFSSDEVDQKLLDVLSGHQVNFDKNTHGKRSRFLKKSKNANSAR